MSKTSTEKTHTEWRLVLARPAHQDGSRFRFVPKRDWGHARDGLTDHAADMNRYAELGIATWEAWVEERLVTAWAKVDLTVKAP